MRSPRLWNILALMMLLVAAGAYGLGALVAPEHAVRIQILKQVDERCGWIVERTTFSSYFGHQNTSRDVEEAHSVAARCQQWVLNWLQDEGLRTSARERLVSEAAAVFDAGLARRVAANGALPTKLADVGYRIPPPGNPYAATALWLLLAAAGGFGHAAICRRELRKQAQTPAQALEVEESNSPSIDLTIFEDSYSPMDVEEEESEAFFDADRGEYANDSEEYEAEVFEELDESSEYERRFESLERKMHEQEQEQWKRDRKAERERLDEQRREVQEARERKERDERERKEREVDARRQLQKERERDERERDARVRADVARKRAEEERRRQDESRARDRERREKAEYDRRERETEVVFSFKGGGHQTVSGGSAFGARMAAENRLKSDKSIRGYVIRNKNGKVIAAG